MPAGGVFQGHARDEPAGGAVCAIAALLAEAL